MKQFLSFIVIILLSCNFKQAKNKSHSKNCNNKDVIEFGKLAIQKVQLKTFITIFPPDDSIHVTWRGDTAIISSTYLAYGFDSTAIKNSKYELYILCGGDSLVNLGKSESYEAYWIED